MERLIVTDTSIYEIDELCMRTKQETERKKEIEEKEQKTNFSYYRKRIDP